AQLGHGGYSNNGDNAGSISVTATAGDVVFDASRNAGATSLSGRAPNERYVMLGHGGMFAPGSNTGDISVTAGGTGKVQFTGGANSNGFAQLGHGGRNDHRISSTSGNNNFDGFYPGTQSGNILVNAGGDIDFDGGSGGTSYVQLGHGGFRNAAVAGEGHEGTITAISGGTIDFAAGTSGNTYAMLGHGGTEAFGDHGSFDADGDTVLENAITVQAANGLNFSASASTSGADIAYAQLGHGGFDADFASVGSRAIGPEGAAAGTYAYHLNTPEADPVGNSGNIGVFVGIDRITGTITNNNASITFNGGGEDDGYAQLGHGGSRTDGDHSGDIKVVATGGITFEAADTQDEAYVQLGHGGLEQTANTGHSGKISVAAGVGILGGGPGGGITFTAGDFAENYAQLGHGGRAGRGDHTGLIEVIAPGDIAFTAGDGLQAYAQLGHGGNDADLPNGGTGAGNDGEIRVASTMGSIVFTASNSNTSYVQLGNGGTGNDGDHSGDITVRAAQNLQFIGGDGVGANAQLGNGGRGADGNHSGDIVASAGTSGVFDDVFDIDMDGTLETNGDDDATFVNAGVGGVTFSAGDGTDAYAQLGHGGRQARGDHEGDITLDSLDTISFTGGNTFRAYAMLGHGGHDADDNATADLGNMGDILVNTNAFGSQLATADIEFLAGSGEEAFVQLGHGGLGTQGTHSGTIIDVRTERDISFASGDGSGTGNDFGSTVTGDGRRAYAMLGHGGHGSDASATGGAFADGVGHSAAINVLADTGSVTFTSSDLAGAPLGGDYANWTLLGHGGFGSDGDHSGNITVQAGLDVAFTGGGFAAGDGGFPQQILFSQLGHGGYDSNGHGANTTVGNMGDIKVLAGRGIAFAAGDANRSYVQAGHGGYSTDNSHSGTISLRSGYNPADLFDFSKPGVIFFAGGAGADSYAQAGHGGRAAKGDHSGRLEMLSTGDIDVLGGAGDRAYAMVGHGGHDADEGDSTTVGNDGAISVVSTGGGLNLTGGANPTNDAGAFAQIGHGGLGTTGQNTGNIVARFGGDVLMTPGSGDSAYVQIGHGGKSADADNGHQGTITVTAGTMSETIMFGEPGAVNGAQDTGPVANRDFDDVFDVNMDTVIDATDLVTITNATTTGLRVGALTPGGAAGTEAYSQIGH
ncbi:MAG: hypothetical protein KDM91_21930, partial [Verrucomicrobiae bacterium]|nr:hypothetical protein [Verrucomicrobiae bacterium]